MDSLKIILGFLMLLAGSQLHWLVVAVACMIGGDYVAVQSIRFLSSTSILSDTFKYGALGLVFSVTAKPFAVLTSGFVLGGFLVFNLPEALNWQTGWFNWLYFLFAGSIVVMLMFFFYSFTWILVTSFSGAVIIVQNANFGGLSSDIMLALFIILGLASQLLLMNYNEPTID